MRVRTSNLSIRFYAADGWTRDAVVACLRESFSDCVIQDKIYPYSDYSDLTYFIAPPDTLDIDRLCRVVTSVARGFDDYPKETDREHLVRHI